MSDLVSFSSADITANRQGDLTASQRHQLQPYIQSQGNVFISNVMIAGTLTLAIGSVLTMILNGVVGQYGVVVLIVLGVVGVIAIPHSLRLMHTTYRALGHYRENTVDALSGICRIHDLPNGEVFIVFDAGDDQIRFILADSMSLQPGESYHVYYVNDVLLSFERA
jgi:hypothetical protein